MAGVILYGPPASGKDTVTRALHQLDARYVLFPRLKAGPGRTTGYRMTTESEIDRLRDSSEIVWENHRYGATYVIDRAGLARELAAHVPVVHLGQVEAVDAVIKAVPGVRWLVVHLWCPRDVAAQRIASRATGDDEARLDAWDLTKPLPQADLAFDTSQIRSDQAAAAIHASACG